MRLCVGGRISAEVRAVWLCSVCVCVGSIVDVGGVVVCVIPPPAVEVEACTSGTRFCFARRSFTTRSAFVSCVVCSVISIFGDFLAIYIYTVYT